MCVLVNILYCIQEGWVHSSCLAQIPFSKDCGTDDECVSDLQLSVKRSGKQSRWVNRKVSVLDQRLEKWHQHNEPARSATVTVPWGILVDTLSMCERLFHSLFSFFFILYCCFCCFLCFVMCSCVIKYVIGSIWTISIKYNLFQRKKHRKKRNSKVSGKMYNEKSHGFQLQALLKNRT